MDVKRRWDWGVILASVAVIGVALVISNLMMRLPFPPIVLNWLHTFLWICVGGSLGGSGFRREG